MVATPQFVTPAWIPPSPLPLPTTNCFISLVGYPLGVSNWTQNSTPDLSSLHLPHKAATSTVFRLNKWQFYPLSCSGQKPWSHPWLLSLSLFLSLCINFISKSCHLYLNTHFEISLSIPCCYHPVPSPSFPTWIIGTALYFSPSPPTVYSQHTKWSDLLIICHNPQMVSHIPQHRNRSLHNGSPGPWLLRWPHLHLCALLTLPQ